MRTQKLLSYFSTKLCCVYSKEQPRADGFLVSTQNKRMQKMTNHFTLKNVVNLDLLYYHARIQREDNPEKSQKYGVSMQYWPRSPEKS